MWKEKNVSLVGKLKFSPYKQEFIISILLIINSNH